MFLTYVFIVHQFWHPNNMCLTVPWGGGGGGRAGGRGGRDGGGGRGGGIGGGEGERG